MKEFSIPLSIIAGAIIIALAIMISNGFIRIGNISFGGNNSGSSQTPNTTNRAAPEAPSVVTVSLDDDPVNGEKNAPVTIVEFSDYECPFCKRHFDQTYPLLRKDYIDTGKVKLVYRDLPLDFHQNAHIEAQAANCARDQGGDTTYFKYHDEIFKRTTSNGTGLSVDQLPVIAEDLELNVTEFQSCLDSGKYKEEVDKDLSDAGSYGATGTPSFFIGKSGSGNTIEGTLVVGAQPYSAFKSLIDSQL